VTPAEIEGAIVRAKRYPGARDGLSRTRLDAGMFAEALLAIVAERDEALQARVKELEVEESAICMVFDDEPRLAQRLDYQEARSQIGNALGNFGYGLGPGTIAGVVDELVESVGLEPLRAAVARASPGSKCAACERTAAAAETLLEVNERLTAQLAEARAKIADLVAYTRRGVTP